eukprot:337861-Pyramimonas_sp.AAC.1
MPQDGLPDARKSPENAPSKTALRGLRDFHGVPQEAKTLQNIQETIIDVFSHFRSRRPSEASKWLQDGPKGPQERPKRAPRRPQEREPPTSVPRRVQEAILGAPEEEADFDRRPPRRPQERP